jgi:hypothetical protein
MVPDTSPVALSVTRVSGLFSSPAFAAAGATATTMAQFFAYLHMNRHAPPGAVGEGEGAASGMDDNAVGLKGLGGAGPGQQGGGAEGAEAIGPTPSKYTISGRNSQEILASLAKSNLPWAKYLDPSASAGSGAVAASGGLADAWRPDIISSWHSTVPLGPDALETAAAVASRRAAASAQASAPSVDSDSEDEDRNAHKVNTDDLPAAFRDIAVFGVEYVSRFVDYGVTPSTISSSSSATSTEDVAAGAAGNAIVQLEGGMRFNLSYVLDPSTDSLHEICFRAPEKWWAALWEGEDDYVPSRLPTQERIAADIGDSESGDEGKASASASASMPPGSGSAAIDIPELRIAAKKQAFEAAAQVAASAGAAKKSSKWVTTKDPKAAGKKSAGPAGAAVAAAFGASAPQTKAPANPFAKPAPQTQRLVRSLREHVNLENLTAKEMVDYVTILDAGQ